MLRVQDQSIGNHFHAVQWLVQGTGPPAPVRVAEIARRAFAEMLGLYFVAVLGFVSIHAFLEDFGQEEGFFGSKQCFLVKKGTNTW